MRLYTSELVKKYKARTVVDHVSIDVNQGEIVGLLGPRPVITNRSTLAIRADCWDGLVVITIMAIHRLGIHVKGQGDITIRTGIYMTALPTHNKARITPTVEHEDYLLFFIQAVLDGF